MINATVFKSSPSIDAKTAADLLTNAYGLAVEAENLTYVSWPQMYGDTSGPFGVPGALSAQAMTLFRLEAWHNYRTGTAVVFCDGTIIKCGDFSINAQWGEQSS